MAYRVDKKWLDIYIIYMGIFNNPPQGATKEEFHRIMSEIHNIPEDARKRLQDLGEAYFTRPGIYNRIRKEDLPQFMKAAHNMLPSMYHNHLPELQERLEKAVHGQYGGF